jgi:CubicO group peptidase (beta-lactamase class C family)
MHRPVFLFLIPLLAGCVQRPLDACRAVPARSRSTGIDDAVMRGRLDSLLDSLNVPGIQMAILTKDGREWVGAAGCADIEANRPMGLDEKLPIGSVTKTMLGASVMKLQERGKLSLDDKVSKYLPDLPRAEESTLRQLLTHTSAVPDFVDDEFIKRWAENLDRSWTLDELLVEVRKRPFLEPGHPFLYGNGGHVVASKIVEMVAQQPWDAVLRDMLSAAPLDIPAWMPETVEAKGYGESCQGPACWLFPTGTRRGSYAGAAGDRAANARTVVRWAQSLYAGNVLAASMQADVSRRVPAISIAPNVEYGPVGMLIRLKSGREVLGHPGDHPDFSSFVVYEPKSGMAVAILVNQASGDLKRGVLAGGQYEALVEGVQ